MSVPVDNREYEYSVLYFLFRNCSFLITVFSLHVFHCHTLTFFEGVVHWSVSNHESYCVVNWPFYNNSYILISFLSWVIHDLFSVMSHTLISFCHESYIDLFSVMSHTLISFCQESYIDPFSVMSIPWSLFVVSHTLIPFLSLVYLDLFLSWVIHWSLFCHELYI